MVTRSDNISATLLAVLTGVSFSLTPNAIPHSNYKPYTMPTTAIYQTISSNEVDSMIASYRTRTTLKVGSPKDEALALFGEQSSFTDGELATYRDILAKHSRPVGISVTDLI